MAVDKMSVRLMREGLDDVLHPRVARVHRLMNETIGNNPSLPDLMILRKQFGAAAKSLDADERRLASIAIDRLDKFVESGDSANVGRAAGCTSVVGANEAIRDIGRCD